VVGGSRSRSAQPQLMLKKIMASTSTKMKKPCSVSWVAALRACSAVEVISAK
jgi:hypothetical protein